MVAHGTVRTATEARLVELCGALPGFSTEPEDGTWWVTSPVNGQLKARRALVIGVADGTLDPDGIAGTLGPTSDAWTIACGLVMTDCADLSALEAKQAVENALNTVRDLLIGNGRLAKSGDAGPGCRDLAVRKFTGPFYGWEAGQAPLAWCDFDISAAADITRRPPT